MIVRLQESVGLFGGTSLAPGVSAKRLDRAVNATSVFGCAWLPRLLVASDVHLEASKNTT